jgi:hypothetical protein
MRLQAARGRLVATRAAKAFNDIAFIERACVEPENSLL